MKRENITCPVCSHAIAEGKNYCAMCSWSIPDDCTLNEFLFEGKQLEEYRSRFLIQKRLVAEGSEAVRLRMSTLEAKLRTAETRAERLDGEVRALNIEKQEYKKQLEEAKKKAAEAKAKEAEANVKAAELKMKMETVAGAVSVQNNQSRIKINQRGRGRSWLQTYSIDEICRRIKNGTFEDLYVGDYFELPLENMGSVWFVIAGFDCMPDGYKGVDGKFRDHFAVIVPEQCMNTGRMYISTLDNKYWNQPGELAYKNSYMYKTILPFYAKRLQKAFNNHILHKNGECELQLLSKKHFPGSGDVQNELPLFREYKDTQRSKVEYGNGWYWLREQEERGRFAACDPKGNLSSIAENADGVGIRPYFCIG